MLSYHVIIDTITDTELDHLLTHLKTYKPPYINIVGGSRFEQAQNVVERFYYELPEIEVILRHWPDDGLIKKYNYNMEKWYNEVILPHEVWLKQYQPIWLLDNESTEHNLTRYAKASADAMDLMGNAGLRLAVGRFATGNPKEHQYSELDAMWLGLKKWNMAHVWSPNEYFDKPNSVSGAGSIARYELGLARCKELGFEPEIVIGEFGLAVNYDPQKGYDKIGLDQTQYAEICLEYDEKWYQPKDITACVFSVGDWHGFGVQKDFFLMLENNKPEIPPIPPEEPVGCFEIVRKLFDLRGRYVERNIKHVERNFDKP